VLFVKLKEVFVPTDGNDETVEKFNQTLNSEIKNVCSDQLPPYMVPRAVSTVDVFPLNSNGKIDRGKLPTINYTSSVDLNNGGLNGLDDECDCSGSEAPLNGQEFDVRALFAEVLRVSPLSLNTTASFFSLGGDSLTALLLLRKLREQFSMKITVADLFSNSSIREICKFHSISTVGIVPKSTSQLQLLTLKVAPESKKVPLVLIHAAGASGLSYRALVEAMDPQQIVYAVDDASLSGEVPFILPTISAVAESVISLLKTHGILYNHSKIQIGGWSYGGVVALEVALLLEQQGFNSLSSSSSILTTNDENETFATIDSVVLFDSPIRVEGDKITASYKNIEQTMRDLQGPQADDSLIKAATNHFENCTRLLHEHYSLIPNRTTHLSCPIISFRPVGLPKETSNNNDDKDNIVIDPDLRLHGLTSSYWHTLFVDGDHWTMLFPPNTAVLARNLQNILDLASNNMVQRRYEQQRQQKQQQHKDTEEDTLLKTSQTEIPTTSSSSKHRASQGGVRNKHRSSSLDTDLMNQFYYATTNSVSNASLSTTKEETSPLHQVLEETKRRKSIDRAAASLMSSSLSSHQGGSIRSSRYRTSSS